MTTPSIFFTRYARIVFGVLTYILVMLLQSASHAYAATKASGHTIAITTATSTGVNAVLNSPANVQASAASLTTQNIYTLSTALPLFDTISFIIIASALFVLGILLIRQDPSMTLNTYSGRLPEATIH